MEDVLNQDTPTGKLGSSPQGSINLGRSVGAPLFFLYLLYIQATCFACLALLLLGVGINHAALCEHYLSILGTRFVTSTNAKPVLNDKVQPVIYLCNHRSWGDFWVDTALLGGTSFVARWAVIFGIPFSGAWGYLGGFIWFFNRGAKRTEGTTKWMANFYAKSHRGFPSKGVVVYPEGTRTLLPEGLPLKAGGLVTVYSLRWPVQIVITSNKERVMAERDLKLGLGTVCQTAVSEPIRPQDFESANAFIAAVEATWKATWEEAYSGSGKPRPTATLPGAVRPTLVPASFNAGLNRARLLIAMALVFKWRALRQLVPRSRL